LLRKIGIIGGGIIGLALAFKLGRKGYKVTVFEKENVPGKHQSGRNSGVLHCGLYYQPGSLKAKLSVDGIREMTSFCKENKLAYDICGKVVVASTEKEIKALDKLANRGKLNGLSNLKYLNKNELKKREPFVKAIKTLLVPEEGIVDYNSVMEKLVKLIREQNGEVLFDTLVNKIIKSTSNEVVIKSNHIDFTFDYIIACSGLWSDKVFSNLSQKKSPLRIIPFRGEYLKFKSGFENIVNHLVYPVPDARFPFLGVHFTRMIDGGREVGPNAVLALKREGYQRKSFNLKEAIESITYPGLIRFIGKNFQFSIDEFKSSFFLEDFISKAQKIIPDVNSTMLERGSSGVRAQAISPKGELQMDFNIVKEGRQIHLLNAPSPGATASFAIASHIIQNYLPN
jgi:(S)-2-hydroxyglutarate dehydrogenase